MTLIDAVRMADEARTPYCRRKEAALRQIMPTGRLDEVPVDDVYGAMRLPEGDGERPYIVLNMVSTVDGKVALGGSAGGIGSRQDRRLMRQIRSHVDAVMIGAGTLRAEICDPRVDPDLVQERVRRGLRQQPLAVAVSGTLNLEPTNRFLMNGRDGTAILTLAAGDSERHQRLAPYAHFLAQDGPTLDLAAGLRDLADQYGVRRLLCEGGPSLNQQLLDAGLIDEVFWTQAPKLAGGIGLTLVQGQRPAERIQARLELVSLYADRSELFARYRLLRGPDGAYLT